VLTYQQALIETASRLKESGSTTPELDALLLLCHVTGKDRIGVYATPKEPLTSEEYSKFDNLVGRREKAEPMAYILGEKGFWEFDLKVRKGVLIPRPDTESLVEAILDIHKDRNAELNILELGVGTGAIILSLLHEMPNAKGLGVDVSPDALACAEENAEANNLDDRLTLRASSWFDNVSEDGFDVIVSNPPYIRTDDIPNLMRDVAHHEPSLALDGGNDGLDAYRHIIDEAPAKLKAGGLLAFEIGYDQADDLKKLLKDSGNFTPAVIVKDLAEHDRVVLAHRL
jgi:release factor glutamine methyltransferase|tara:strand:+ start:34340 stop:35194 length:855 start_codon:yes stop_codon:yes gene_type:complete